MDSPCVHNALRRVDDDKPNLYSCDACGEMFTTERFEIVVQKGKPK